MQHPVVRQASCWAIEHFLVCIHSSTPATFRAGVVIPCMFLQICFGLCIYRGVIRQLSHIAFIYFMCAASVFGVALIHFIMVRVLYQIIDLQWDSQAYLDTVWTVPALNCTCIIVYLCLQFTTWVSCKNDWERSQYMNLFHSCYNWPRISISYR